MLKILVFQQLFNSIKNRKSNTTLRYIYVSSTIVCKFREIKYSVNIQQKRSMIKPSNRNNCKRSPSVSFPKRNYPETISSDELNNELMKGFPALVEKLLNEDMCPGMAELKDRIKELLNYHVKQGKNAGALASLLTYKKFEKPENLTSENLEKAVYLAWCTKMVESYVVLMDDIVDEGEYRYNRLCWHKKENVGLTAVVDLAYMRNTSYYLLKKKFSNHPNYMKLLELFSDVLYYTAIGQSCDIQRRSLEEHTLANYKELITLKTSYFAAYLPVMSALYLANVDAETCRLVKPLLFEFGHFAQMQNDYLDCYENPERTGKLSSDIPQGRLTWLSVKAYEKSSPTQHDLMKKHYGIPQQKSIKIVENLYNELDLSSAYKAFESEQYCKITTDIKKLPKTLPQNLFLTLLDYSYQRKWQTYDN